MNTKGKIDFTKTDNIQFIEEVAREISKEDKNWQWEAREIKQHSLLLWWEYMDDEKQEGFRIEYDEAEEVFSVYDELDNDITAELEDTLVVDTEALKKTIRSMINKKDYLDNDTHIDLSNTTDRELKAIEICFREQED